MVRGSPHICSMALSGGCGVWVQFEQRLGATIERHCDGLEAGPGWFGAEKRQHQQ